MPEAKVYVLTRPLENEGRALSYFGDGGKHWALIVEFLDGSGVYLCDLTSNDEGVDYSRAIQYTYTSRSGNPGRRCVRFNCLNDCQEGNIEAKLEYKGRCNTTVGFLSFHTQNIFEGEQYHLLNNNCQRFVEKFLELLKVTMDSMDMDSNSNIYTNGLAGGVDLLGAGLLASVLLKRRNSNRN